MPLTRDQIEDDAEKTKLLTVRGLIEQLLREHDLCADVVLGGRGRIEVFTHLEASWCRAMLYVLPDNAGHILRLRSMVADYGGDREAQRRDLEDTVGMVSSFAVLKAQQGLAWLEASRWIDREVGAEHTALHKEPKQ